MANAYLIQTEPRPNGIEATFSRVREMVLQANPTAGSLILLPEMFATGFLTNPPTASAEDLTSREAPTPRFLQALADETQCAILGGGIEAFASASLPFCNWTGLFHPCKSTPQAFYRKRHPFADEAKHFTAGTKFASFDWQGFSVSPFICFDLRFPEDFRLARASGASLLTVQAEWPTSRALHFKTLLRARAIENQCYVLACSRAGKAFATSSAFGPNGEELLDADSAEKTFCVNLDVSQVNAARANFPLPLPKIHV